MEEPRKIPLEWIIPEGMEIVFANHMLITDVDGQMIVTFFQAVPPIVLEGESKKADSIEKVPAMAVARLAIPPQQMPSIIDAFKRRYDRLTVKTSKRSKKKVN